jgi:hypothetical protein
VRADRNRQPVRGRPDPVEVPTPRGEPFRIRAWSPPALAAGAITSMLDALTQYGVVAWHGVRLRGTRRRLDHLVVAPAGVFLVFERRWRGRVELRSGGKAWRSKNRLVVGAHDRTRAARTRVRDVVHVREALGPHMVPVQALICVVDGDWPLWPKPLEVDGVGVVWPKELERRVCTLGKLDADAIGELAAHLEARLARRR